MRGDDKTKPIYVVRRQSPYGPTYLREDGRWTNERGNAFRTGNRHLVKALQDRVVGKNRGTIVRLV